MDLGGWLRSLGLEQTPTMSDRSAGEVTKSMTTIGHVFIPLDPEHNGAVPTDNDEAHFESLPVPLALWEPFQQCLSKHLSQLTEGQIDREEMFWFDAGHVNAMIAVVEAEAVTTALDLREWLTLLAAFARRAADRRT